MRFEFENTTGKCNGAKGFISLLEGLLFEVEVKDDKLCFYKKDLVSLKSYSEVGLDQYKSICGDSISTIQWKN
jgi:hypothetical protein